MPVPGGERIYEVGQRRLRKPGDVARALELLRRSYEMALASGAGKTETG